MATERRPKGASEILRTLHELSLPSEDEILAMSAVELTTDLNEQGIDITTAQAELRSELQTLRGKLLLAQAREHRQQADTQVAISQPTALLDIQFLRSEIQRKLAPLFPAKTQLVQAYFNRFESAEDDDLPALLEDLQLLDELDASDE